jgi:DNA-binding helix-hairpin-helix protein with protein kinase domain
MSECYTLGNPEPDPRSPARSQGPASPGAGGPAVYQLLRKGQIVKTELSNLNCSVGELLGAGSQGEVYRAVLGSKPVALKWYFPHYLQSDPELRRNLRTAIERGSPSDRFLWPIELAVSTDGRGFGYVMPLREERYKSLIDIMKRRAEPTFRSLASAGFEIADSYLQLHSSGLCYSDISFGNVFLDPKNGQVCICDNDNVHVDGQPTGIGGTIGFMAPEIVRGEAMPSSDADLFSLAVLLFYLFMLHHPLEGQRELEVRCFDYPAKKKLYGLEPLFIFDPGDDGNRPLPGYHDNALAFWPLYPGFLKNLFIKSFTTGLWDPKNGRVRESEWRAAMIRLRDSIVYCRGCGAENFCHLEGPGGLGLCWSCHAAIDLPFRIQIGRTVIMLNHDTELFPHHIESRKIYDFTLPVAAVSRHPTDPGLWGLKNLSQSSWTATDANGTVLEIAPGLSVSLAAGRTIDFGRARGEILL